MAASSLKNRFVKATLIPNSPIRTKEPVNLRLSKFTNCDTFLGSVKASLKLKPSVPIVLEEGDCTIEPSELVSAAVEYCHTGQPSLPLLGAEYDEEHGCASFKLAVTTSAPRSDEGVSISQ